MHPTLSHGFSNNGIVEMRRSPMLWRNDFRDNCVAICHQDRFSTRRKPHVFTQFVFEDFDTHGLHSNKVASGSYPCQRRIHQPSVFDGGEIENGAAAQAGAEAVKRDR